MPSARVKTGPGQGVYRADLPTLPDLNSRLYLRGKLPENASDLRLGTAKSDRESQRLQIPFRLLERVIQIARDETVEQHELPFPDTRHSGTD
jgi:hypothetical protein